jgi:hypothetical protein
MLARAPLDSKTLLLKSAKTSKWKERIPSALRKM